MTAAALLADAVGTFCAQIGEQLAALSNKPAVGFLADVANEASNIVGGVLAADGRCTDGELDAYLDVIGPLLQPPLVVSNMAARELQLFGDTTEQLSRPSVLFDLLCRADAQRGSQRSHLYYEHALRLAHVAAALDLVPSASELTAIDGFRSAMLQHLDSFGIARPGRPAVTAAPLPSSTTPAASSVAPTPTPTTAPAPAPARSLTDLLAELDRLRGPGNVKAQ
ncbi:MAG TPA: hypothetical protein DCQ52_11460, partial [Acidimicrobiaceae bacterium]|nr:hypothetical protein [Acidimicrobiaceae bacterium]